MERPVYLTTNKGKFQEAYNTVLKKSLYSGRNEEEHKYRHNVRYNVIPKIVIDLFETLSSSK